MKQMFRLLGALVVALTVTTACSAPETKPYNEGINIIPVPAKLTEGTGAFTLDKKTVIAAHADFAPTVEFLKNKLQGSTGYELATAEMAPASNYIAFVKDPAIAAEGYTLQSTPEGVAISASTDAGAFFGMQTLLQLLPAEVESPAKIKRVAWTIPAVSIEDAPRFGYRGIHIDEARHFFGMDAVKKMLDAASMYKVNRMHWHLTEDQLWVIEIKKYPELTEKGSFRVEGDSTIYGPFFYTQEQIKEIVAYAAERHIEVIPEIEMPGHGKAVFMSHPEFSCTGGPFTNPRNIWGVEDDVFCAGNDDVFAFLTDVLAEVAQLFPSQYIHIGGDECPKVRWQKCPKCQARIKALGLDKLAGKPDATGAKHTAEELLQSYFITRMEKVADSLGKRIIGWDEILEGGLAPSATVMSWRGEYGGVAAASQDHDVIMTPSSRGLYINFLQGAPEVEPASIGGASTLKMVYDYEPLPAKLDSTKHKYILGPQCNMWSEYILTPKELENIGFPRICALAEIAWSQPSNKNWEDFQRRLNNTMVRLDYHDIYYHIPWPEGTVVDILEFTGDSVVVPFTNTRNYPMVYTLDGKEPSAKSTVYDTANHIVLTQSATLKIATLVPAIGKTGGVRTIEVVKTEPRPAVQVEKADSGIVVRVAKGLYPSFEKMAAAQFGPDSLVGYFQTLRIGGGMRGRGPQVAPRVLATGGPRFDMEKPSLAVYEGYVEIPEDGVYGFTTDMTELWIDGERIVVNGFEAASRHLRHKTTRALAKGKHSFKLVVNNMIVQGWPTAWNSITFYIQKPGEKEYLPVPYTWLSR